MTKHKTIWLRLATVSLAALMLCGCTSKGAEPTTLGSQPTQPTQPSSSVTQPSGTEPQDTVPPITEPPVVEPPVELDSVTELECTKWRTFPELLSLGGGRVLACRNQYSSEHGKIICTLEVIDVYSDTVTSRLTIDSARELVRQQFGDGMIVVADAQDKKFYVYDQSLKQQSSFCAPGVDGFFSYDRQNYYFVEDEVLYRMDVASGNRGRKSVEQNLRLERLMGIHPTEDLLVARVYLSSHSNQTGLAVIDARTGTLRLLSDRLEYLTSTGDAFYGVHMNDDVLGYDVYCGTYSGGAVRRVQTDAFGGDTYGYSVLPGSHLLVRRQVEDYGSNTTIYDMKTGASADLESYGYTKTTYGTIYLQQEQLILGFYADGYDFKPVVIDPKVLTYTANLSFETVQWPELVNQELIDAYHATVEGPALPAQLNALRTQADAIEQTYGIKILMGQQVSAACNYPGYGIKMNEDAAQIQAALTTLEQALAKYPAGFLSQLRNSADEGGLWFCLSGQISGSLDPVGFTRQNRQRCDVVLDITASGLEKTIHHEIWHAIEMRVSSDWFNTTQWAACNPDGFKYYEKYDRGYQDLTKWTYTSGDGTNVHFVDSYSRINGREDRARIMEYVMAADDPELMAAPAIRAKLQIMADVIRQCFDTTGWSNVYWERFS